MLVNMIKKPIHPQTRSASRCPGFFSRPPEAMRAGCSADEHRAAVPRTPKHGGPRLGKDAAARWLAKHDVKTARWWRGIVRFTHLAREGGAYDSHHRAAGIAGRTRRRGGVAACSPRATGRRCG